MSDYEIDFNLEHIDEVIGDVPDAVGPYKKSADRVPTPHTYRRELDNIVFTDEEEDVLSSKFKSLMNKSKQAQPKPQYFKEIARNAHRLNVKQLSLSIDGGTVDSMPLNGGKRPKYKPNFYIAHGDVYQFRVDFVLLGTMSVDIKYEQVIYRFGHPVNSNQFIVKTMGIPKNVVQSVFTTEEWAPTDMLHEGLYTVKSLLTDVLLNKYMEWEWCFQIGPKPEQEEY